MFKIVNYLFFSVSLILKDILEVLWLIKFEMLASINIIC